MRALSYSRLLYLLLKVFQLLIVNPETCLTLVKTYTVIQVLYLILVYYPLRQLLRLHIKAFTELKVVSFQVVQAQYFKF